MNNKQRLILGVSAVNPEDLQAHLLDSGFDLEVNCNEREEVFKQEHSLTEASEAELIAALENNQRVEMVNPPDWEMAGYLNQQDYDELQYARDREQAYPPMPDQLDDIFHNGVAGWKKTIQAVKDTYPKP
jgi:hypothetical protein